MSLTKNWAILASSVVAGVVAFAGCSSSNNSTTPNDAGSDDVVIVIHKADSGSTTGDDSGSGSEGGGTSMFDGTTGKPCTMDSECRSMGGPGINKCSNAYDWTVTGIKVQPLADARLRNPHSDRRNQLLQLRSCAVLGSDGRVHSYLRRPGCAKRADWARPVRRRCSERPGLDAGDLLAALHLRG